MNMASITIQSLLVACILSLNSHVNAQPLYIRNTTSPSSWCSVVQDNYPTRTGQFIGPWQYNIGINNKQTPEKDSPGQGLLDNIWGECHNNPTSQHIDPLGYNLQTDALAGYNILFQLPATIPDTTCVERAIQKAENKTLRCEFPG